MSTFQGLELAKKALFAQRGGLYTTGHNIANVNTEGYSRQRVNFQTTTPFPVPSRVQPNIAGQIGTGVKIGTIQRIRDQFLDFQYRTENSRLGYWSTKQEALSRMEEFLNEPSDNGMNRVMDHFWQSLEELANNPDNSGARSVVAQRGLALAETYNNLSKNLQSIQADLKDQIDVSVKNINSLLRQINSLNEQIKKIEPHGYLANDLYDERDRLIDKLSEHMNIKVHYSKSSESALDIADGIASIEVLDSRGQSIGSGVFLIDARSPNTIANAVKEINVHPDNDNSPITHFTVDGQDLELELMRSNGSLSALIESFGYVDGEVKGTYPEMLAELDRMAAAFANEFNRIHHQGIDLNGDQLNIDFFVPKDGATEITAENITINPEIMENSDLIAAGDPNAGSRNGDNALELGKVFDNSLSDLGNTSTKKFYTTLIGELGVKGQEAKSEKESSGILKAQVSHSRMSVSAVSLDEEISNLITFQHAYNAAARSMTSIDELLDKIINQMGLVGR